MHISDAAVITAITAAFLFSAILGTIIWGFSVAFYIELALVPLMLALILALALSNPPLSERD